VTLILILSKIFELKNIFKDILSEKVELFLEAIQGIGMPETIYY
jgi:hypothetical protein